ncbi:MAG: hypothetical protein ACI9MC_001787 [Kiritimatiellia bacterium]|jgi:hypothetical protein
MRPSLTASLLYLMACSTPTTTPQVDAHPTVETAYKPTTTAAKVDLVALHAAEGSDPVRATELWLMATLQYADPATRDQGRSALTALTLPFQEGRGWETLPSAATFKDRMLHQPHILRSYAVGATPANGYAAKDFELNVHESRKDPHGRGWAVLVISGGADSPRPIYLKEVNGLYYPHNFSNAYVAIRPPKQ